MGLARIVAARAYTAFASTFACLAFAFGVGSPARADEANEWLPESIVADRDDDDGDGIPDAEGTTVARGAYDDLAPIDARLWGSKVRPKSEPSVLRIVADGKVVPWNSPIPKGALFQGVSPGVFEGELERSRTTLPIVVRVFGVGMRDDTNAAVDMARAHASLERTPPALLAADPNLTYDDPDALRIVWSVPSGVRVPASAVVTSLGALRSQLDRIELPLSRVRCDAAFESNTCVATVPLRLVVDDVDRVHPLIRDRSIRAEVGGTIVVSDEKGMKLQRISVGGPRRSPMGPIGIHRIVVRPFAVRGRRGGPPPVGRTDAEAIQIVRTEIMSASAVWGQCGFTFGPAAALDVRVINPPPSHLLSFGDDLGLPASGGVVRFRAGGSAAQFNVAAGWSPRQAATAAAELGRKLGFKTFLSENARITPGAEPSVDVSFRRADNSLVELTTDRGPLSTDTSLSVRIGSVDFSDGLSHFGDMDSMAGTLEERTLVKAIDDGDIDTVEVIVVPDFSGGGRIGESFIGSDRSSVRNVVLVDRAGIGARKSSATLAHEIGHVLLDVPGHPDDFGVDTPTRLMDSDAADASAFGPRRLTLEECAAAVRQSGPSGPTPLLRSGYSGR